MAALKSAPTFELYYSARSPFARRVRLALQRLLVPFEPKEINVFEPSPEFLKASPLGTVPALIVRNGGDHFTLGDSATILEYLHDTQGGKVWPSDLEVRSRVRAASTWAEGLMTNTVALFLETQRSASSQEYKFEYEENIRRTLRAIQAQPLNQLPWKVSDFQLTQAGYDLVIALEYMELRAPWMGLKEHYGELFKFLETHRKRQDLAPTAPPTA